MIAVDHPPVETWNDWETRQRTQMDETTLIGPIGGGYENDNEIARWSGYVCRCHGFLVQRSADVQLKKWPEFLQAEVGDIK